VVSQTDTATSIAIELGGELTIRFAESASAERIAALVRALQSVRGSVRLSHFATIATMPERATLATSVRIEKPRTFPPLA
jgi:hypothetical protein